MFGNAALWRAIVLLTITGLGSSLPVAAVAPGMSLMAPVLGDGATGVFLAQQVMTIPGLAMLIGAPVIGWCIERVGYRPMLLLGLFVFMVSGLACYVIANAWLLIAVRFVVGLSAAAMLTPTYALVSYYFQGQARDRLLGYMAGAAAVVGISIALIAGKLVTDFGWRSVFLLWVLTIVPLVLAVPVITDTEGKRTAIKPPPAVEGERAPLGALLGVYVLAAWLSLLSFNPTVQIPFLFVERGLTDPTLVSLVISIISATMILVSPFYGWIAARLSTRLLLGLTLAIFAVGHLMVGGIDTLTPTLVASVFFGIGATLIQPVCTSYLLTTLPPSTHGRAMGGLIGCLFLGQFINPFIMQPLIATMHLAPSLVFLGVLNIAFALLFAAAPLFLRRSAVKG